MRSSPLVERRVWDGRGVFVPFSGFALVALEPSLPFGICVFWLQISKCFVLARREASLGWAGRVCALLRLRTCGLGAAPAVWDLFFWLQISKCFVLAGGTATLPTRSSPLVERRFWDGHVSALVRLPSCETGTVLAIPGFPPALTISVPIALAGASLPRSLVSMLTRAFKGLCLRDLSFPLLFHYCRRTAVRRLIVEMSSLRTQQYFPSIEQL